MIISFKCKDTEAIFNGEKTKKFSKAIINIGKRKLDMIEHAHNESDLRIPPSNHFELLKGDLNSFASFFVMKIGMLMIYISQIITSKGQI
jgi:proteic killer suppression protein